MLDLTEEFYLETIDRIFQKAELAIERTGISILRPGVILSEVVRRLRRW